MFGFFRKKARPLDVAQEVQAEFIERVIAAAADFVAALPAELAAQMDFSPASLAGLDAVAERVRSGELALTPMQRVGMATYLYEVARRRHGGQYAVIDNDDPVVLVCGRPGVEICLGAIGRIERLLDGRKIPMPTRLYAEFDSAIAAGLPKILR